MQHELNLLQQEVTRRQFFRRNATGIGAAALGSLLNPDLDAGPADSVQPSHFPGKAKRVIYLFMHGGPSQMELFDYKPRLKELNASPLPDSVRGDQRLTGMTSNQKSFPVAAPNQFRFQRHGESGTWVSDALPHMAKVIDDVCVIKSMHTEAINHDPAVTLMQTGHQQPGRPSFGAWSSYGLGSENQNLPAFVVLISDGSASRPADPLYARLWGTGFLPSSHQGVNFRKNGDPVLYLSNPSGLTDASRRSMLDSLALLNQRQFEAYRDPEIQTRIAQYEMAYRMQTSVPDLTDFSNESEQTFDLYGEASRKPELTPPTACWPGEWQSGVCGSFNSITGAGTSITICPATCACSAATSTSRLRGCSPISNSVDCWTTH